MPSNEVLFGKFGKSLRERTISDDRRELLDDEDEPNEED
jgi:hypothetical protein|tara:strand:- start:340 stop:456 length:117 start_codon:yes stop_codon:yes gene_type:complete